MRTILHQDLNKVNHVICVFLQVDAIEYYSTKEKELLEDVRKQVELVPQRPLGIAFVTLQTEAMAK